jgi:hypothetical protein
MIGWIICDINWSNISGNWMGWFTEGYTNILGVWFYPLVFAGIIGYVYALSHSATAAAVTICLAFGIFGVAGIFADVPQFANIMYAVILASFSGAMIAIFAGRKR